MEKVMNTIKKVLIYVYIVIIFIVTICMLSFNDYKVTVFGNTTILPVIDEDLEPYKEGSLLIIDKGSLSKVEVGDVIFFYKEEAGSMTVNFAKVNKAEYLTDTQYTYTVQGIVDDYVLSSDHFIGEEKDVTAIPVIGKILSLLESKWGFLFLGVFPAFIAFLYTLYAVILEIKGEEEEEEKPKKKKSSTKKSDDAEIKPAKKTKKVAKENSEETIEENEEKPKKVKTKKEVEEKSEVEDTKVEVKVEVEQEAEPEIVNIQVEEENDGPVDIQVEEENDEPVDIQVEKEENENDDDTEPEIPVKETKAQITEEQKKALIEAKMKSMTEEQKKALLEAKLKSMTEEQKRALIEAKRKKMEAQNSNNE